MDLETGKLEAGRAGLPGAENLAFAAQAQVLLGNHEPVFRRAHDVEAGARGLAEPVCMQQDAGGIAGTAPDTAAQLVQLCQPEALRVLDHHDRGIGHVDAHFDDSRCDENARAAFLEVGHGAVLFRRAHAAVDEADLGPEPAGQLPEARLGGGRRVFLVFLDERADPVDLATLRQRDRDAREQFVQPLNGDRHGAHGLSPCRLFVEPRDIHVAIGGQDQGSRDRRRGHDQHVGLFALGGQQEPLVNAKAVLLIDNHETEIGKIHALLEQGMCADEDVDMPVAQPGEDVTARRALFAAGQEGGLEAGLFGQRANGCHVLAGQHFGRHHQRRLRAGFAGAGHGHQRHDRLARADIALEQAQHALAGGHVRGNLVERSRLRPGQRVTEGRADCGNKGSVTAKTAPAGLAHAPAHQCQRQLPGQQFVMGQPPAGRGEQIEVGRCNRIVQADQRFAQRRPVLARQQGPVGPFGQVRETVQHLLDALAQDLAGQACGHRIDRFDERQVARLVDADHVVRVDHGCAAVEPFDFPGNQHRLADRQCLFQPVAFAAEEGEGDLARFVMAEHAPRHPGLAARRRLVPVDAQCQRDDGSGNG